MGRTADKIRQELLANDPEFRRLSEEHAACARQLDDLLRKASPSSADLSEAARLKKLKLQAKDRMEERLRAYRRRESEAVEAT